MHLLRNLDLAVILCLLAVQFLQLLLNVLFFQVLQVSVYSLEVLHNIEHLLAGALQLVFQLVELFAVLFDCLALRLLKHLLGSLGSDFLSLLLGFVDLIQSSFFVLGKAYILLIFIHDGERHFGLLDNVLWFLDFFTLSSYLLNEFALLLLFLLLLFLVPLCLLLRIFQVFLDLLQLILSVFHRTLFFAQVAFLFWWGTFGFLVNDFVVFGLSFVLFDFLFISSSINSWLFNWLLFLRSSNRGRSWVFFRIAVHHFGRLGSLLMKTDKWVGLASCVIFAPWLLFDLHLWPFSALLLFVFLFFLLWQFLLWIKAISFLEFLLACL